MKRTLRVWLTLAACIALVLGMSGPAAGGPLDRQEHGQRYNPAADSMLRVPGVIGLSAKYAMAVLQRRGLNPRLEFIRKVDKRYQGREGTVIDQLPLGGGVAMYGSSVTITVYEPPGQSDKKPVKP